ncbi:hypothetical protein EDD11_001599 [Mortierella claussenii]|nr:hypothetical protein EDD11_001599 [Mortierella claussenii]
MEAQQVSNPWLQHPHDRQQHHHQKHLNKEELIHMKSPDSSNNLLLTDAETISFEDFFEDHKKVFYRSQLLLQQLHESKQQKLNQDQRQDDDDGEGDTDSQCTAWSRIGMDSPMNQSSVTLADWIPVPYTELAVEKQEGVPQSLIQSLQSEVEDTRSTVNELEEKLVLAEHSSRRIVEELKALLAEAEVTLRNASEASDNSRNASSSQEGLSGHGEDPSIVYSRICVALQDLIGEAQLALQNLGGKRKSLTLIDDAYLETLGDTLSAPKMSEPVDAYNRSSGGFDSRFTCSGRGTAESLAMVPGSITVYEDDSFIYGLSAYSATSFYSATDECSRIYWRQKHEEQHDRYRKSCHRLTLELERNFHGLSTDSDDSETSYCGISSRRRSSIILSSSSANSPRLSTLATSTRPLQGILRSSKKDDVGVAKLKKRYQVQFLNADAKGSSRKETALASSSRDQKSPEYERPQYTSRSVGSTRSRSVILQLYDLWQHTWLRTRMMHVITGSVEIVIIIWVVIKASHLTLTWFGIQPSSVRQLITFIYGHRGKTGTGAKELYAKIRKDGLQLRQIKAWSPIEPETLVEDLVAGAAASTSLITPSKVVYGPAKSVIVHAATGAALAFLSASARGFVRKLL